MKKALQSLVLGIAAYGCIENQPITREGQIQNNETMTSTDNGICTELESGQYHLNDLVFNIIEAVKVNTTQVSETCLFDNNQNVDYLSDGNVTFWKDETGKHRVVITPEILTSGLGVICSENTNGIDMAHQLDIALENVNIYPIGELESLTSSNNGLGYTRYSHLTSFNIGILERDGNNTCGMRHNPNIDTCHADNIVVSRKSDDFGTFWCVSVEGGFR